MLLAYLQTGDIAALIAWRNMLLPAEMRAQGRHKSSTVLPRYAKRTMKQVAAGTRKRRAARTDSGQNGGHLSE